MGTHPIFESNFDCLTEGMSKGDIAQQDVAARVIQRAWRRYTNMEPYKWCRNMLFHAQNSGDPRIILRLVSPHDTQLADHATGVRLRLRLGVHSDQDGEKLAVFFKVFTKRTVVDICSMSPKVYSAEPVFKNKLRSNAPQNNRGYVRKENNGWRVVAWDSLITHPLTSRKDYSIPFFHHDPKARKNLERLKKKLTHRRWLRAIADNPENFAEDNDVDELVKWAEVLDVDQYKDNWMNLVTLPSL